MSENRSSRLLTTPEAAERLGLAAQTLNDWRCTGRVALPFVRVGSAVRYRIADLDRFVETNTVSPKGVA